MSLISKVYRFYQQVYTPYTLFPLKWDNNRDQWRLESHKKGSSPFKAYMQIAIPLKLTMLFESVAIILTARFLPDLFDNLDILAQGMLMFALLISFHIDHLTVSYTSDLIVISNWTHQVTKKFKLSKKEELFIYNSIMIPIFSLRILFFLWFTTYLYLDKDPIFCVARCFDYCFPIVKTHFHYYHFILFKISSCLLTLFLLHIVLVDMLSMVLITISEGMYRGVLLLRIEKCIQPSNMLINFYNQCVIVSKIIKLYDVNITSMVLCSAFFSCLIFSNIFVLGCRRGIPLFIIPSLTIFDGFLLILNAMFIMGCIFFKSSTKTLRNWRHTTRRKSLSMSKQIKSMSVISVPAGNMGIIDVEIKVNYFYSLLMNTTNSMLTVRSIFKF